MSFRLRKYLSTMIVAVASFSMPASDSYAGVSVNDLIRAGMPPSYAEYAAIVSANEGNWGSVNQFGCLGAFQFCPGTFERYYNGTKENFLNNPSHQVNAWMNYQKTEWRNATKNGFDKLVGQRVCYSGRCGTITESSILMACQFGCGPNGKLGNLSKNGLNCDAPNVKDGNNKSVCDYLIDGAGRDVSEVTGNGKGSGAGGSGVCLARAPWSTGGQQVISPYGEDRSHRPGASRGVHQGLDIVNSAGRGDPLYAAIDGKIWQTKNGSGGLRVVTETGDQRFIWMHLDTISKQAEAGQSVSVNTQIGTMGGSGTKNNASVHHHLGVLMRGDAVKNRAGNGSDRVFKTSDGQLGGTKMSQPLSSQEIANASPKAWYFVQPERFLYERIPYNQGTLAGYNLDRPGGLTLENTCSPQFNSGEQPYSSNGGISADEGAGNTFVGGGGTTDYELDVIENSERSFMLDLARQTNAGSQLTARAGQIGRAEADLSLGLLIINELDAKL